MHKQNKDSILRAIVFVIVPFFLLGCDSVYRLLQKEGAEEKELLGDVIPFERNERVAEVQQRLKLFGYTVGNVDGALGANTREAIAAFQEDCNLKVTRFVDNATWAQLHVFDQFELIVDDELNMKAVQQALKKAKFDPGAADGRFGPRTDTAIKNFQAANGLQPDGKAGFKTLSLLSYYLSLETTGQ